MAGRPKRFDPDLALESAMDLFWEKGYASTSMAELLTRMGICRQSLYDTFGDKHKLYLAALDLYCKRRARELVGELVSQDASLPEIKAVFERTISRAECGARRPCMLGLSSMERGSDDFDVTDRVRKQLDVLEDLFVRALENAKRKGELSRMDDPRPVARHLLNTLQGLGVLLKGGAPPEHARDVVNVALSVLV